MSERQRFELGTLNPISACSTSSLLLIFEKVKICQPYLQDSFVPNRREESRSKVTACALSETKLGMTSTKAAALIEPFVTSVACIQGFCAQLLSRA